MRACLLKTVLSIVAIGLSLGSGLSGCAAREDVAPVSLFKTWYNPKAVDQNQVATGAYLNLSGDLLDAYAVVQFPNSAICYCKAVLLGSESGGRMTLTSCNTYNANSSACARFQGWQTTYKNTGTTLQLSSDGSGLWIPLP